MTSFLSRTPEEDEQNTLGPMRNPRG